MEWCIISLCFICLAVIPFGSTLECSVVHSTYGENDVYMQVQYKLDTIEDAPVFWEIDSQVLAGFVHYAESTLDIDTSILNLTNPNEFNAEAFGDAKGIWYFAHHVMFEASNDPWVIYATFNFTHASVVNVKFLNIRYYLHGDTVLQAYRLDGVSENITRANEVQGWEEIVINLDELELDPENGHTENRFRLEFHTSTKNQDFFLLDKIVTCSTGDGDPSYIGP